MSKIGSLSIDEVLAKADAIARQAEKVARPQAGTLLPKAKEAAEEIRGELDVDTASRENAEQAILAAQEKAAEARERFEREVPGYKRFHIGGFYPFASEQEVQQAQAELQRALQNADVLEQGAESVLEQAMDEVTADEQALRVALSTLEDLEAAGQPVQVKSSYKSGIAAVWNPKSQQVEWRSGYKTGVAGVWNPKTEQVEWKSAYNSGVAGVWNPKAEQVEWKTSYMSGVGGVWNPKAEQVEWKSSYMSGVAGVWNPQTEQVEWDSAYKSGIAGHWDAEAGKAAFTQRYQSGVAMVVKAGDGYLCSSGWYGGLNEDD